MASRGCCRRCSSASCRSTASTPARSSARDIRAILEPSIEEYAFVTPRDAGSPFFAVSIKYRVNVYLPDGKLADSWGFTGYGTSPSQGLSSTDAAAAATALAMRDAGAKLAVEFREQAVLRGLLPESESVDAPPPPPTSEQPASQPAVSEQPVEQPAEAPVPDNEVTDPAPPPPTPEAEPVQSEEEKDQSEKEEQAPPAVEPKA